MSEEDYLLTNHREEIVEILECKNKDQYFSINISFFDLLDLDTVLGNAILTDPEKSIKQWNRAALNVQLELTKENMNYIIKTKVNCRIHSLPHWPHVSRNIFPGNEDANKFLQLNGTVVRMSARKLLVFQRNYICSKCKYQIIVEAQCDKRYIIKKPTKCTNPNGCKGKNFIDFGELDRDNYRDFQEIRIQEDLSKVDVGTAPNHMLVILEDDLVNSCKPGENVTITGVVTRRWSEFDKGAKITLDIVLRALHVQVNTCSGLLIADTAEMKQHFDDFWKKHSKEPLVGRNIILNSFAPEIHGNALIKLSTAVVLAGGSHSGNDDMSTGITTRSESHLLFVGDPGTGKSQMLRFASKIMPRAILTTGVGTTAAGLTVTAIMENGDWQLEAGALILADGGICCIDEFNSMREHDRTSIHEAMEQQTISVAKAGIVCKLKTRCSILAACNPKANQKPSQSLAVNVAMSSALLSRFDIIILVKDAVEENADRKIAQHLLKERLDTDKDENIWNLEMLQAYYANIRKQNPKLTNEAEAILRSYYQLQRRCGNINKSRTTIRLLESLIRLSQGHAKLMYHSEVQVMDATFAVIITDTSMSSESSILDLRIDFEIFLSDPEKQYYELLENVLGKLSLDYIIQMEANIVENRENVEARKNSDSDENSSGIFSQKSISRTSSSSQKLTGKELDNTSDSGNYSDMTNFDFQSIKNNHRLEKPSTSSEGECSNKINNFLEEKSRAKNEIPHKKTPTKFSKTVKNYNEIDLDEICESLEITDGKNANLVKNIAKKYLTENNKTEPGKRKKQRPSKSPTNRSKKMAKSNVIDEKEIIKQLPSINDDFGIFSKHINWDLEEELEENIIEETDMISMRKKNGTEAENNSQDAPKNGPCRDNSELNNKEIPIKKSLHVSEIVESSSSSFDEISDSSKNGSCRDNGETYKNKISNKKSLHVSEIVRSSSQNFDDILDEYLENITASQENCRTNQVPNSCIEQQQQKITNNNFSKPSVNQKKSLNLSRFSFEPKEK